VLGFLGGPTHEHAEELSGLAELVDTDEAVGEAWYNVAHVGMQGGQGVQGQLGSGGRDVSPWQWCRW
jgi:hypothetical protein